MRKIKKNISRRVFLQSSTALLGGLMLNTSCARQTSNNWSMPDEGETHVRTWLAFGAQQSVWGAKLLPHVQRNIATLAQTIARFEPVYVLVNARDMALARSLMMGMDQIKLIECPLDDVWIRDSGLVFVKNVAGQKASIDFNFNGWGNKQKHANDAQVARFMAQYTGVERMASRLILEGGGIEVDGQGTAIITESCVLNPNRNPNVTKAQAEAILKSELGLNKIIWLPGIAGRDITDGHTDFYARFAHDGHVMAALDPDPDSFDYTVTRTHAKILSQAIDARGRKLDLTMLQAPTEIRTDLATDDFAAGYINYYVCNGAVIAPQFGDAVTDGVTREVLQTAFPDREVVQLNIDAIAAGGGGIHCVTQQEPL